MKKCALFLVMVCSALNLWAYDFETQAFRIKGAEITSKLSEDKAEVSGENLSTFFKGRQKERSVKKYPGVKTGDSLTDYFISLAQEEVQLDITKSGVFSAGAKWPTAWTRDMSYAIDLSLGFLFPDAVEKSLSSRVENNMILQDTGSGGSYPVSTDRVVWITAAYDYALVKQSPEYFEWVYQVASNTLNYDLNVNLDTEYNLFKGESSFLDWREQTYPRWCTNEYIANSFALGTNVVYQKALSVMAELAQIHGNYISSENAEEVQLWKDRALLVKEDGIKNHFWLPEKNYFASLILNDIYPFTYEGYETLGESLAVLNGLAPSGTEKAVVNAVKPQLWGLSVVAPQLSKVPSYHNDAVWPFVQAYRALACKKAKAFSQCETEFASMLYAASMFQTFKENYVASEFSEFTQTNSDRQLWSDAGFLAMIYRILFGLEFTSEGLSICPLVFESFDKGLELSDFTFGNSRLNLKIKGTGDKILSYKVNGKEVPADFIIPYASEGKTYSVEITLGKSQDYLAALSESAEYIFDAASVTPMIPNLAVEYEGAKATVSWKPKNSAGFTVFKDNEKINTSEKEMTFKTGKKLVLVSAAADFTDKSVPVFPGKTVRCESKFSTILLEAEKAVFNGGEIATEDCSKEDVVNAALSNDLQITSANKGAYLKNWGSAEDQKVTFTFNAKEAGEYVLDFRFQNGHGPVNTGEKCAVRSLSVDGEYVQKVVFPQLGKWSLWSFTAPAKVYLGKGLHQITLYTDQYCYSQHHLLNSINLDLCRIGRVK